MKPRVILLCALLGAPMLSVPAAAQSGEQSDVQKPPVSPCQAEPDQNGNSGNDPDKTAGPKPPAGDLTRKLAPCNGVLEPPPTGDSGLAAPGVRPGSAAFAVATVADADPIRFTNSPWTFTRAELVA